MITKNRDIVTPKSVADGLQKPVGWNFAAQSCRFGKLIDKSRHREELRALQIAALGIGDLVARSSAVHAAGLQIGERNAFVAQQDSVTALAVGSAVAMFGAGAPCLPPNMFVVQLKIRSTRRRGRIAKAEIYIDAFQ